MKSFYFFLCLSALYADSFVWTKNFFSKEDVAFFQKARQFGDTLIVGVLADDVVEGYKRAPILTLEERVAVIKACRYVDEVIVAPPLRLTEELIREHRIDIVVHGDDFNMDMIEDQYSVPYRLGMFRTVPYTKGVSSTEIIQRIKRRD